MTRVYLEQGRRKVFACAVDWPGWCRAGPTDDAALTTLLAYADRYAAVVPGFTSGELQVIGTVPGTPTTDFGAPDARGTWDYEPLDPAGRPGWRMSSTRAGGRSTGPSPPLPNSCAGAPAAAAMTRDQVVDHVREAERSYTRMIGVRVPPRTPWQEQRAQVLVALRAGAPQARWPVRYYVRRAAWHVLDHAWEVEDKS